MAKLIYSAIASADGYIEDPGGSIDWGMPDEELLGFINELERPARTYLYGRRMYEAMLYWETARTTVQPRLFQEFTGSREDRLLEDARIGVECEDTGRTGLRARPGPAAEVGRRA
jgi:dihydrofolate reductase